MTNVVNKDILSTQGVSGEKYQFQLYTKSNSWNSSSGVYLILRDIGSSYSPVYIGETENLKQRHSSHHKERCFNEHNWSHLAFLYEPSKGKRVYIEQDILSNLNWVCNA